MDVKKSRYLSKLLRHDPEDLKMNDHGYVNVTDLLKKLKISRDDLDTIVLLNDKKRFAYNSNRTQIRASQGHSLKLNIDFRTPEKNEIPFTLYHGTTTDKLSAIFSEGINSMKRHHVHLSSNYSTASEVAKRRKNKQHCIIRIDTRKMLEDGHEFFVSLNEVWLTEHISPIYFTEINFLDDEI